MSRRGLTDTVLLRNWLANSSCCIATTNGPHSRIFFAINSEQSQLRNKYTSKCHTKTENGSQFYYLCIRALWLKYNQHRNSCCLNNLPLSWHHQLASRGLTKQFHGVRWFGCILGISMAFPLGICYEILKFVNTLQCPATCQFLSDLTNPRICCRNSMTRYL